MATSLQSIIDTTIEQAMLSMHSAFIGRVISVDTTAQTAKIEPLSMTRMTDGTVSKMAVLPEVPISKNARKFSYDSRTINGGAYVDGKSGTSSITFNDWTVIGVQANDIVMCLCADRDITETIGGSFAIPAYGNHSMGDAVVVAIL